MFPLLLALLPGVHAQGVLPDPVGLPMGPEASIRATVAAHLQLPEEDVQVRALGSLAGVAPDQNCGVQLPRTGPVDGIVPLVLFCGDGRWSTRAVIETWRHVPVAVADADPGENVEFRVERVSSERLRGEEPVGVEGTWTARVGLRAGEPLTSARVRPAPDLARGEKVRILVGGDGLVVTAEGEALRDAYVDEPIAVLNFSTRAVVQGTYRGDGLVTLDAP
ncbi:MAG: flagellar basal body P-ring formation chaperone FlgA [Myxococcota bacterium]